MITFARTHDMELVRSVFTHVRIWPHISDDGSPPVSEYQPVDHESVWYVAATYHHSEGEDLLGIWMFVPQNAICWEVHTAVLPCGWGDVGLEAARFLPGWIWRNTRCRRIITNVPSTNRLALHFALKAGMKIYGVNRASYLKGGKLCDQVCLGLSPPEVIRPVEEREGELCGKER